MKKLYCLLTFCTLLSLSIKAQKQGNIWYYICDDNYTYYPMQHPAPLFEVIDDRLSSYWRFKCYPNGLIRLAFEECLTDPYFYDKLTDQEEREVLIFDKIKQLIDNEKYPQKSMFNKADKSLEKAKILA